MKKVGFLFSCVVLLTFSSCKKVDISPNSNGMINGLGIKRDRDTIVTIDGKDYVVDKNYIIDIFNTCQITDPNRDSDFIRKRGKR